jgi:hypothetical protein
MTRTKHLSFILAFAACKSNEASTTNADATDDGPTSSADSDPSDDDDTDPSDPDSDDTDPSDPDSDDTDPSDDDDTTDPTGDSGAWPAPEPGEDVSVVAFDGEHMYWVSDDDEHRDAEIEVEFPGAGDGYAATILELGVRCPDGGCDYWDRYGSIAVVENPGTDDERSIEIARFVTPYRVEGAWSIDVSHLRPILTGTRTLRLHVDTWVGPGSDQGAGWLVDARFDMTGGVASPRPVAVIPIYTRRSYVVGDPAQPISDSVPAVEVDVPSGLDSASLVSIITGHGQGNSENCAEFCQDNHGYLLGGQTAIMETVWRTDCYNNPIADQVGNWMQSRAGWCPGADVIPWIADITDAATPGETMSIEYAVSPYENTCRPGLDECTNCGLLVTCEYDGNNHTEPHVRMSTVLIGWVD